METVLKLYALGAAGNPCGKFDSPLDIATIMRHSAEQGIWQSVFAGLKQAVKNGDVKITEEQLSLFEGFNKQLIINCIQRQQKWDGIKAIIGKMEDEGIKCCVLKGETLAVLYQTPECRASGDVDLLISEKDEPRALEILRESGFEVEIRAKSGNHDECFHESLGALELHVSLYYDIMQDVWFDNQEMITEPFRKVGDVWALGITDGYIYTLLHAVKHFLSNGLCVKQIMDVLLYEKAYRSEIDFERVNKLLTHLKYKSFSDSLKSFGLKYFGFKKEDFSEFQYDENLAAKILNDVFEGGLFGKKEERSDFFEIYNAYRFSTFKKENFNEFMTAWRRKNVIKSMSFSCDNMKIRYPYVNKKLYLLPVAWLNHVFVIIKTGLKRFRLVKQSLNYTAPKGEDTAVIEKRIALFKEFDMI